VVEGEMAEECRGVEGRKDRGLEEHNTTRTLTNHLIALFMTSENSRAGFEHLSIEHSIEN
jgi:hypothetical protein